MTTTTRTKLGWGFGGVGVTRNAGRSQTQFRLIPKVTAIVRDEVALADGDYSRTRQSLVRHARHVLPNIPQPPALAQSSLI